MKVGDIIVKKATGERFIVKYFDEKSKLWMIEDLEKDDEDFGVD